MLKLHLDNNKLQTLRGLILPADVEVLNISENQFKAFDHPSLNPKLCEIILTKCKIKSFDDITFPSSLDHIDLSSACIESFEGFQAPAYTAVTTVDTVIGDWT